MSSNVNVDTTLKTLRDAAVSLEVRCPSCMLRADWPERGFHILHNHCGRAPVERAEELFPPRPEEAAARVPGHTLRACRCPEDSAVLTEQEGLAANIAWDVISVLLPFTVSR